MDKSWIISAVIEKGGDARRWLESSTGDTTNFIRAYGKEAGFSKDSGVLLVHMRGRAYSLQVLEVNVRKTAIIWVGDGQTKIRASFKKDSVKVPWQSFQVRNFDLAMDTKAKPEMRITLQIHDFVMDTAPAQPPPVSMTNVEHEPKVHNLLKSLERLLSAMSPIQSQTSESPLSQDEVFATQLPTIGSRPDKGLLPPLPISAGGGLRRDVPREAKSHAREDVPKHTNVILRAFAPTLPKRSTERSFSLSRFVAGDLCWKFGDNPGKSLVRLVLEDHILLPYLDDQSLENEAAELILSPYNILKLTCAPTNSRIFLILRRKLISQKASTICIELAPTCDPDWFLNTVVGLNQTIEVSTNDGPKLEKMFNTLQAKKTAAEAQREVPIEDKSAPKSDVSKHINPLLHFAPKLPKRTDVTKAVPGSDYAIKKIKSEAVIHADREKASRVQELPAENISKADAKSPGLANIAQKSTSPSRHVLDPNQDEPHRTGALSINGSSDDAEVLGDSEKENGRQNFAASNPSTTSKDQVQQLATGIEHGVDESCLEDDPYKGRKRIPRSWLKIPKDQRAILDDEDSWFTPRLPESVLRERRALDQGPEPVEEVKDKRIDERNSSSASENNNDESDSEPDEPYDGQDHDSMEVQGQSQEHQRSQGSREVMKGHELRSDVGDISKKKTEAQHYSSSPIFDEPRREYSIPTDPELDPSDNDDEAISWPPSNNSMEERRQAQVQQRDQGNFEAMPRHKLRSDVEDISEEETNAQQYSSSPMFEEPQREYSFPADTEVDPPDNDDESTSCSTSPERDLPDGDEANDGNFDEDMSVVPESSIPESSLALRKNLATAKSVVPESSIPESSPTGRLNSAAEKHEASKLVQVVVSIPTEEEDDNDELEVAEPSAFGNAIVSAEDSHQNFGPVSNQQATSTASQEPAVVEVERTPHIKSFGSKIEHRQVASTDIEGSSTFIVLGTAEEEHRVAEVTNTFPTTTELPAQSSKSDKQVETSLMEHHIITSSGQDSLAPELPSRAAHFVSQSSTKDFKFQHVDSSTESQNSKDETQFDSLRQASAPHVLRPSSPNNLHHDQSDHQSEQCLAPQTMGQECSLYQVIDSADVDPNYEHSARTPVSKQYVAANVPNESNHLEASSNKHNSTSIKRKPLEAELVPPPAKRKLLAKNSPPQFMPGTQPPVDLEKLKKSNRDNFLEQLSGNKSAQHSPEANAGTQYEPATSTKQTVPHAEESPAVLSARGEANEDSQNIGSHASGDQAPRGCPASKPHENIYERYRQAYPDFTENLHKFIRACVYIEYLTDEHLMPMLWDDFVQKNCRDYPKYVVDCQNQGQKHLTGIKWYNVQNDITYQKNILNRDTFREVSSLDRTEFEKARKPFRQGEPKPGESIASSAPKTGTSLKSSRVSDVSDDVEILGTSSATSTGKRKLPWISPQRDITDTTSRNKRQRLDEGPSEASRTNPSVAVLRKQPGGAIHARQASPELDVNLHDMRPSREVARTDLSSKRNKGVSFSKPKSRVLPAQSLRPGAGQPRPQVTENVRTSMNRTPSRPGQSPTLGAREPRPQAAENMRTSVSRTISRKSCTTADDIKAQATKWIRDKSRKRTTINLAESEGE